MASRGVNKVILLGNVGQDPETRYTTNGDQVTTLSLATSEVWKDANGQQQERTEWHSVTFWRKLAEIVSEYVKKGSKIYIEGRIQYQKYEKDGVTQYRTQIIADQMQMLGGKEEKQEAQAPQQGKPYNGGPAKQYQAKPQNKQDRPLTGYANYPSVDNSNNGYFDDDIPF